MMVASDVAFTLITIVSAAPQVPEMEYMTVSFPIPAIEGSNMPVEAFVIPEPDHVPPLVAEVKVIGEALTHNVAGAVIDAFELGVTVTSVVSVFPHVPAIV